MVVWKPFLQYVLLFPKTHKWRLKQLNESSKQLRWKRLTNELNHWNRLTTWRNVERFRNFCTKETTVTRKSIFELIREKNLILDSDQKSLVEEFQRLQKGVLKRNESGIVEMTLQKAVTQLMKTSRNIHFRNKNILNGYVPQSDGILGTIMNSLKNRVFLNSYFLRSKSVRGEKEGTVAHKEHYAGQWDSLTRKNYENDYRCLYVWGGVGRGKTMLMDIFFESLPITQKKRYHFHTFMLHLNNLLYKIQNNNFKDNCSFEDKTFQKTKKDLAAIDPLLSVTYAMAFHTKVICLDEFQVIHIADAMILKRALESLWNFGCLIVVTSNRPPEDLYQGGLNRDLFLPFIDFVKNDWNVYNIGSSEDYRVQTYLNLEHDNEKVLFQRYWNPGRAQNEILENLASVEREKTCNVKPLTVSVDGNRQFQVPYAVGKACAIPFIKLCQDAVGVSDYMALCKHFDTLFLYSIPVLDQFDDQQNEIRRFIKLIDIFYEKKKKVIFDCDAPLLKLFGSTEITTAFDQLSQVLKKKYPQGVFQFYEHFEKVTSSLNGASTETLLKNVLCGDLNVGWNRFSIKNKSQALKYYANFGCSKNDLLPFLNLKKDNATKEKYSQPLYTFNFCKRILPGGISSNNYDDNAFAAARCLSRLVDMVSKGYGA